MGPVKTWAAPGFCVCMRALIVSSGYPTTASQPPPTMPLMKFLVVTIAIDCCLCGSDGLTGGGGNGGTCSSDAASGTRGGDVPLASTVIAQCR